jgi:hypothetical protein
MQATLRLPNFRGEISLIGTSLLFLPSSQSAGARANVVIIEFLSLANKCDFTQRGLVLHNTYLVSTHNANYAVFYAAECDLLDCISSLIQLFN